MSTPVTSVQPATEEDIVKAIAERKAEIERLEKGMYGLKVRNRAYVADVEWPYRTIEGEGRTGFVPDDPALAPYDMVSATYVVDRGTQFYAKSISFALIANGTIPGINGAADAPASVIIPAAMRSGPSGYGYVNFRWRVRSTGSDREWQNQFLPDWLLMSGSRNGLRFRRGQFCLVGGSETTVTVAPIHAMLNADPEEGILTGFESVQSLRFQFVFRGVEVEA